MSGKWQVRKGVCPECYQDGWVVYRAAGDVFGCRNTFSEAIFYATRKARVLNPCPERTFGLGA